MDARGLVLDLLGLAGLAAVGVGCWWIFPPASLIVVGSALVVVAVMGARNYGRPSAPPRQVPTETGERWRP